MKRFLAAAQASDMEAMRDLMDPSARIRESSSVSTAAYTRRDRSSPRSFVDVVADMHDHVAEGDCVVVLATMAGRSKRSGERFAMPIAEAWRVTDGRVVEISPYYLDMATMNDPARQG